MDLEYKQFDFAETLRDIDFSLGAELDDLIPKNQFVSNINNGGVECANASVIAVNVRLTAYDNGKLANLSKAYVWVKRIILALFQDNSNCIDIICMGRYFCGIYNAPVRSEIDGLIETMSKINAALSVLDIKLFKEYSIHVSGNCGCDFGELFKIYEVFYGDDKKVRRKNETWHGAALNMAVLYSESEIKNEKNGTIISDNIRVNLKDEYAKFFPQTSFDAELGGYWASLVDSNIFEWVKQNR